MILKGPSPEAELIRAARRVRRHACAPYSNFKVGAALLADKGTIFPGCNIENATLGLTVCAERVALWKALSEGFKKFHAIAVVAEAKELTPPCGACRQILWEYCGNVPVHLSRGRGKWKTHLLEELLPLPFDKRFL